MGCVRKQSIKRTTVPLYISMEHCLTQAMSHNHPEGSEAEKWKSSSFESSEISSSGGFDCNICLDSVQDPVVTLCGHLYCWPCLYKWIHLQSISPGMAEQQPLQCPVCKAEVSESTLVPLYGPDSSLKRSDAKNSETPGIPRRPKGPACGIPAASPPTTNDALHLTQHNNGVHSTYGYGRDIAHYPPYYGDYSASSPQAINFAGSTTFHPVISMFGKMISPRSFSNHQSFYANPTSYSVAATSNARSRRQVVQADRSLSRLSLFLLCCLALCLLLF